MKRLSLVLALAPMAGAALAQTAPRIEISLEQKSARESIQQAESAPGFERDFVQLDAYRALQAAHVPLSAAERQEMGEMALIRGLPIEAEAVLRPLVQSGAMGGAKDKLAVRNLAFLRQAEQDATADREGGLVRAEAHAAMSPSGHTFVVTGEAYLGAGNFGKAADLIQKGIAKGGLAPGEAAIARLNLGIAQLRSGQADAARRTWDGIRADNGVDVLARAWTAISLQP